MPSLLSVYKCDLCGNVVDVIHPGDGELYCCGQPMKQMEEKTADTGKEKHVPVIEQVDGGYRVTVGSVEHPMEDDHYIEWIELQTGARSYRQFLKPGDAPQATFKVQAQAVTAREFCNKHGLWKGQ